MVKVGKKWQQKIKSDLREKKRMADPDTASVAFARAWQVYLLINTGIDENDERRVTLDRFIRQRSEAGVTDAELLVVEGLKYMKRLDQSGADSPE
jgi:hypothetical protein